MGIGANMKKILSVFGIILLVNSCGQITSEKEILQKTQDQSATEFVLTDDLVDKPEEQMPTSKEILVEEVKLETPKEDMRAPVEPKQEDFRPKITAEVKIETMKPQEFGKYRLANNETLMMASFKIYGDYRRWKELKKWNKDALKNGLRAGLELKYSIPEKKFVWEPSGLPYLVKTGNTLGSISKEKYGTKKKWKDLYENNRPLIIDPNIIFAGFTIYYIPTRDIASQKK